MRRKNAQAGDQQLLQVLAASRQIWDIHDRDNQFNYVTRTKVVMKDCIILFGFLYSFSGAQGWRALSALRVGVGHGTPGCLLAEVMFLARAARMCPFQGELPRVPRTQLLLSKQTFASVWQEKDDKLADETNARDTDGFRGSMLGLPHQL